MRTDLPLYEKGLERGTFERPVSEHTGHPIAIGYNMTAHQLQYILNGVVLKVSVIRRDTAILAETTANTALQPTVGILIAHCFSSRQSLHIPIIKPLRASTTTDTVAAITVSGAQKMIFSKGKNLSYHPIPMWCNQTCSLMINWVVYCDKNHADKII